VNTRQSILAVVYLILFLIEIASGFAHYTIGVIGVVITTCILSFVAFVLVNKGKV
jgi:hypothetical protein